VQSSFNLGTDLNSNPEAHKLANSPSTGQPVLRITNDIMKLLMKEHSAELVCIGKAYDTDVKIPFWFKHFGKPEDGGAGDAYHIGVFGRTGSGKTVAAANMILGYAKKMKDMSILILDPQEQFYNDINVIPGGKFENKIKESGANYIKKIVPDEVYLPGDAKLLSELLLTSGFIKDAFNVNTDEKKDLLRQSIEYYINSRIENPGFYLSSYDSEKLLSDLVNKFCNAESVKEQQDGCSSLVSRVYSPGQPRKNLISTCDDLKEKIENKTLEKRISEKWEKILKLFKKEKTKISIDEIVEMVTLQGGNVVVLNISGRKAVGVESENLQALFIKAIQKKIIEKGSELYVEGKNSNCLVVMDEAHRYVSYGSLDPRIKELTNEIIDAVRTTRKYGIGYMFITQTLESLHEEIRRQMRIFAFGYGLTSGSEFSKIKDIINDDASAKFYKSFIDPTSNKKFPFMFYGPISPLSFTGSPLFLEMDKEISDFNKQ
jgi:DNA helicase HerA-like ATPase